MIHHPFRFGVVAGHAPDAGAWAGLARRAESLGYDTLLVPDTLGTLSPFAAGAAAATATTTLGVGTYVLCAPLRTPEAVAWETATLRTLSGGRFELGLGAGRPDAAADAVRLGVDYGTPSRRIDRLERTLDAVEDVPILIAATGPKMLRLAAARARTVALGLPPHSTEEHLAAKLDELYELAGDRFKELELNINLAVVGDEQPAWTVSRFGALDATAVGRLSGTVEQMVDRLNRRRDKLGVSYVSVNGQFLEQFAPVVERLAGT
ncbi:LLM class flavin-dependent oxidoreductase [Nonomuraea glycinis]|uniref:N5,N10-methylene tetrahydromethanopterin reductase n=1 Tax=Nonomuraea glycinis TaxID=2047744 RepID=A0A918A8B9_9ACTN|nr:LLM class flavin-dependent oxidoreductase [Nonomuraea glycinis]MCA2179160.1 LLM class flavin-dependent oxidoreductase [Nonomuraea glycinis]GGP10255.1 N5,N10-methylene tetrahydromethanopterin reductase [Nonomuraea glycinis]